MIDDPELPPVGVIPTSPGSARWCVWAPDAKRVELILDPGPSADAPYETPAEELPRTLEAALAALQADAALVDGLGKDFVDYYCHIKQAEIARFNLEVTEWEHREYFDMF